MRQLALEIAPLAEPSLEGFVAGANGAALAHLQQLAMPAAPLYLWGPAGSGKTHLLQALAARSRGHGGRAGGFGPAKPPPWPLDAGWSLVVVDDCEALDAEAQHAAFVLFTDAQTHGVQFAAAGAVPPVDLPLREDLRTRLAWGHVFALQPLTEAETRSALRREADRRGIFLPDEVMGWLLLRFARDLGTLMHWLDRLDRFGLARARRITVPLVRELLAEEGFTAEDAPP